MTTGPCACGAWHNPQGDDDVTDYTERPQTISHTTHELLKTQRRPEVARAPVEDAASIPIIEMAIIRQGDVSYWLQHYRLKNPQGPHVKAAIDLLWRSEQLRVDLHALLESIAEGDVSR